jgi:uncharacterized repeat protein (TIGR03803 family)
MRKFQELQTACMIFLFCAVTAIVSPAQTFRTLVDFNSADGSVPDGGLVQGANGNFYGTTSGGGNNRAGTVFRITHAGVLTTLHSFGSEVCGPLFCTNPDGQFPSAGLVQGTDGNFYGTTSEGGTVRNFFAGEGTIFKITPEGALTTLYTFCSASGCADGSNPEAGLVQGTDGNFYGTTYSGGNNNRAGTVFKITPEGILTTLYTFCSASGCADGSTPYGGLVQGSDGNFYGTTLTGGNSSSYYGTVFRITSTGVLTTLYIFCSTSSCTCPASECTDGVFPAAGLVQGTDGNFYGTTSAGGFGDAGTAFKITPAGALTTLYNFCSASAYCSDGAAPEAGLVQGTDGNFYGTTNLGGNPNCSIEGSGCGTIFKITPEGTLTTLYSFCSASGCTDGSKPLAALVQGTNGNFYGTTPSGGNSGYGAVFSLSVGLDPFLETRPTSGPEGAKIGILGQGFTSSSIVKFGGVQATTVKLTGKTFLTATVPAGALTGSVTVSTGSTKLTSNQKFRVTPQLKSFTPSDGQVGTVVTITGTGLKQTSKITFDGVQATVHTVESDTQVEATVPTGAKTGKIAITTPGGTVKSATSFTVTE